MSDVLNINVGLLGHVDSGKTSLAKCLSEVSSTACFDKHPQSQERGITIDLGFSSFGINAPDNFKGLGYVKIQFTLVDCPGHASLIRTIIGGIHIIDIVILVIDVTKGIQTQTAECLVISEVTKKPYLIALNKIDLIEENKKEDIVKKVTKKLKQALSEDVLIVPIVAKEDFLEERGIHKLIDGLRELLFLPKRLVNEPLVLAVDHCFLIKGRGTVLTGTVLQGRIKINDAIEIPVLKEIKKVKSIQMFKHDVPEAVQGDRIGVCVKQFEPSQLERGLACSPGYIPLLYGVIIVFNKVQYFKGCLTSNSKYHISIGHETVIGKIKLFSCECNSDFSLEGDYEYIDKLNDDVMKSVYALIEFEKAVYVPQDSVVIGSKLDVPMDSKSCRLAFYGNIIHSIKENNLGTLFSTLKIFKLKEKSGTVQNFLSEREIIGIKLCKKHSSISKFINFKVTLSTGESGYIEGPFGQKDKVRIIIPENLKPSTLEMLSASSKKYRKNKANEDNKNSHNLEKVEPVRIRLLFKRYLFDKDKTVSQNF